jgi:hypothetical protein
LRWAGEKRLRNDDSGQVGAEFSLETHWSEWCEWLNVWMVEPNFSVWPELQDEILPGAVSDTAP